LMDVSMSTCVGKKKPEEETKVRLPSCLCFALLTLPYSVLCSLFRGVVLIAALVCCVLCSG
jgi:hypothetical protein